MHWTTRSFLALAAVCSLAGGGVAQAQGARQHDGFYLHLDLGGGGFNASADEAGTEFEFSGGAGTFSAAVGYNVVPNFVIAGHLWGISGTDPDFEINGVEVPTANDITVGVGGIGVNFTYYFMPINIYLSATPSITTARLEVGNQEFETDPGFGLRIAGGKEWWVSDSWALGLNLQYVFSTNDAGEGSTATWDTNFFGIAFSATYD